MTRPFPAALQAVASVLIAGRSRAIERRAGTAAKPILRVSGSASRSQAEAWRGEPLWVPRGELPPLEEDEYYAEDVAGCAVWDHDVHIGVVVSMSPLPSCHVLSVRRDDGSELLVPFVRDAVRAVDIAARRVDIDLAFLGEA